MRFRGETRRQHRGERDAARPARARERDHDEPEPEHVEARDRGFGREQQRRRVDEPDRQIERVAQVPGAEELRGRMELRREPQHSSTRPMSAPAP